MSVLITGIAYGVLNSVIHLAAGSIISIPVYRIGLHINSKPDKNLSFHFFLIIISSLLGLVLPFNIYGIFPIAVAILAAGLPVAVSVPMVLSGTLFNLSVLCTDPTFSLKTGILRIALAFFIALLGGLLLLKFKNPEKVLINANNLVPYQQEQKFNSMILRVLRGNIAGAGLYLILGVSINVIFKDYVLYSVLQFIYTNPNTVSIPMYFAQMNVVNPFFIQTMTIVNMFLDLITISGLFLIFKVKGVLLYTCYYVFFALLFGMSALF